jgi:hypothetical protein
MFNANRCTLNPHISVNNSPQETVMFAKSLFLESNHYVVIHEVQFVRHARGHPRMLCGWIFLDWTSTYVINVLDILESIWVQELVKYLTGWDHISFLVSFVYQQSWWLLAESMDMFVCTQKQPKGSSCHMSLWACTLGSYLQETSRKMHVWVTLMWSWLLWVLLIPLSSHELSTTSKRGRFQLAQIHRSRHDSTEGDFHSSF